MQASLSEKDKRFREFSLNGSMPKVVFHVCIPLALYQSLNQLFKILDTMMASHISSTAVSAVAYLSQINMTLSAIGGGLAVGASIKVSEAYGAGDYEMVKKRISTMFGMCAALGALLLLILIPGTVPFLKLMNTPVEFITEGATYFRLELIGMIVTFFNNIYIAIERARGNSKRILWLNTLVIIIKLSVTAWFVYGLDGGINMISIATILSQVFLLAAAMINMNQKGSAFGFSLKAVSFKGEIVKPMIKLSIPVIVEKVAFSIGKVIVNSMSTVYGALTVGALGISNNIGGITTNPQNGFQEGGSSIISQNLGAGKPERSLSAFRWVLLWNIIISIVLMSATLVCLDSLTMLFAGEDDAFGEMIKSIYLYEATGAVPLGINAAVLSLLYGFGKTKITLFMNFCRIFLFRVPVLWGLQQFTDLGSVSAGIVMAVSNILSGVLAVVVGIIEVRRIHKEYGI